MNLKEAFRFQNKLQSMMETAEDILGREQNITRVQNTYLRRKVMAEAEDETMEDMLSVTSVRAVPPLAAITASRHAMTSSSVRVLE